MSALLRLALARAAFGVPAMFSPRERHRPAAPEGTTVLAHGAAPTVAYYFRSRLGSPDMAGARFIDTRQTPPGPFDAKYMAEMLQGRRIIIARHVPLPWLRLLERHKDEVASIVYFMDDDLPGAALDPDLPWRYAMRLTAGFRKIRPLLAKLCDKVMVSTPALAARYPEARAEVLPPLPLPDDQIEPLDASHWRGPIFTIFYHGTASHTRELAFVADIARIVQAKRDDTIFEVFGPRAALRPFAGIPRVRKVHPMPWEDYLAHTRANPMHIGLAPLHNSSFNSFRAATKIFDIARCRALGLYSNVAPFNSHAGQGISGLLLKNERQIWADEILNQISRPQFNQPQSRMAVEAK